MMTDDRRAPADPDREPGADPDLYESLFAAPNSPRAPQPRAAAAGPAAAQPASAMLAATPAPMPVAAPKAGPDAGPGVAAAVAAARDQVLRRAIPHVVRPRAASAPAPAPTLASTLAPAPAHAPTAPDGAPNAMAGGAGKPPAPAKAKAKAPAPAPNERRLDASGEDPYSSRLPMGIGLVSLVVLVFGFGLWAGFADISSAVVAPGKVEVASKQQVVEHPDGGVVREILVRDGDLVAAGDVLLHLDDTLTRSERESLSSQYWEMVARAARLRAEQNGVQTIVFGAGLLRETERPGIAEIVAGQRQLFAARKRTMADQVEQLRERQSQIREQVLGAQAQTRALERQLALVAQELEGQQKLYDSGLAQLNRLLNLQREQARLEGEVGGLTASMAESRGRVAEIEIQILNLDSTRQEQAITQLRDIQYQENQLREQLASAEERLDRLDVRAPIDGVVLGMTVFSVRSVVSPGEPILYLVPQNSLLVIESQIDTIFVDQVYAGQPATLKFSAFAASTTPELEGHVVKISPDAFTDERTGRTYYTATLAPNDGELAKLEGLTLVPGMPVEGYIKAGGRTPLSYLIKPFTDYFSKAMLEE